jgi:hypothetical protein
MSTAQLLEINAETQTELDPIEEMRLRTWARKNYKPHDNRSASWHPVILDEMTQKDREQGDRTVESL